jgi:ABC-type uncharacterized transport system permease subunit
VDQQRKADTRWSLTWSVLSYIPVVAGIAWFIFAWSPGLDQDRCLP